MLNHRGVTCCGPRVRDVRLARSSPSMVQLIRRKCAMAPKRDKGSGMSTATGCNFRRTKKHVSNRKTKLGFSVVTFAILFCPNISPWKPGGMQVWRCMTVRTNSRWHKELEKPTTDELCKCWSRQRCLFPVLRWLMGRQWLVSTWALNPKLDATTQPVQHNKYTAQLDERVNKIGWKRCSRTVLPLGNLDLTGRFIFSINYQNPWVITSNINPIGTQYIRMPPK